MRKNKVLQTMNVIAELEELVSMFSTIVLSLLGVESSEKGLCSPWKGKNLFLCKTNLMRFPSQLFSQVYQVLVVTC